MTAGSREGERIIMDKYIVFIEEKREKSPFRRTKIRYASEREAEMVEDCFGAFIPEGYEEDPDSDLWLMVAVHRVRRESNCTARTFALVAEIYEDLGLSVLSYEHGAQAEVLGGEWESIVFHETKVRRKVQ